MLTQYIINSRLLWILSFSLASDSLIVERCRAFLVGCYAHVVLTLYMHRAPNQVTPTPMRSSELLCFIAMDTLERHLAGKGPDK